MDNDEKILQVLEQVQSSVNSLTSVIAEMNVDVKFLRLKLHEHDVALNDIMCKVEVDKTKPEIDNMSNSTKSIETKIDSLSDETDKLGVEVAKLSVSVKYLSDDLYETQEVTGKNLSDIARLKAK